MKPRTLLSTLPSSTGRPRALRARLALATVSSLAGAVVMCSWDGSIPAALWIPTGLLAASALLLHHGKAGSQLIARSIWWANLVLGTLIALASGGSDQRVGVGLAVVTGIALLAMGRLGLDEDAASAFRPIAFRTTLTLGMIMAVADAQALALFGALKLQPSGWKEEAADRGGQIGMLLLSVLLLALAISGLYRLRLWGLLLATLTAAGIAALAATDVYGVPEPLRVGLILTSGVQILLPVPVMVAVVRGRAAEPSKAVARLARMAPAALVVLMMGASTFAWLTAR